jgi:hypothetical protein
VLSWETEISEQKKFVYHASSAWLVELAIRWIATMVSTTVVIDGFDDSFFCDWEGLIPLPVLSIF